MKKSHVFDPKNIDVLEREERKIWQDPEEILGMVEIKSNFVVADFGCGSGFFTVPLSQKAKKVYGIDIQKEMLEFLERKIQRLKIRNIEPLLSKEEGIPLEDESLDLLVSINTLHEFGDKKRIVEEMRRVLRRYRELLIVDFKKKDTGFGPPVTIRVSKEQVKSLFEKRGFTTLRSKDLMYHYLLVFQRESEYINVKA
ncbi:MAG: methyltransferase domain-containing protein [Candidatus Methylarchaceae archaeon HK02M1]|nr:methyltransferase domain-containing protein [Candidatus Methylarchaceae archaeon HK01M]MCP8312235.1 methyltransferase domain-containing protein [Candidatus Methylarchaceae archaeon HK02M1]